ncbi:MAG TPA: zinc-binding dehydrogenase [Verrucomicrobiae bacterium]|jgi:propanol-preferring alcohol dehydrogenase
MKAVRLIEIGKPLQPENLPVPVPGPDGVLIRVRAAGICHSDAHYRAGVSTVSPLPMTLGHEIAGVAEEIGANVKHIARGARVCVHYMATCGHCASCFGGHEQFCAAGQMIGKHRNGGYAEFVCVPARSVFALPEEVPFSQGAVMMCSSATSLHALRKARLQAGETVAVFGFGGLGFSAVQLALALGAGRVFAVDLHAGKLAIAAGLGAIPINAGQGDPVEQILAATHGIGADVALELIGKPATMDAAVRCLGRFGRAALAGLTRQSFAVAPYENVINKEAEIIGVSDHLASEIPLLLALASAGKLRIPTDVTRAIALDAGLINGALDSLDRATETIRTIIEP